MIDLLVQFVAQPDDSLFSQDTLKTIIIAIFSGGLVTAIFGLISKRSRSPESQNELARLGNEFAAKLLEDARLERKELRQTIKELEESRDKRQETIDRLNSLLTQKDQQIESLQNLQRVVARKLQAGEKITLQDVFGDLAPVDVHLVVDDGQVA